MYYDKYKKKPVLLNKIFIALSKKNLRNLRLDNFFNATRQQKLLSINAHNLKHYYKKSYRLQNKYKFKFTPRAERSFFFIKHVFPLIVKSKCKGTFKLRKLTQPLTPYRFTIRLCRKPIPKKFICFKRFKYRYNTTRINRKLVPYYKISFFKRFKYKYGIRRKRFLKRKFLSHFSKIKYYSRLKARLKQYIIYNFKKKFHNFKKKFHKILYRLKKKALLNKRSCLILPKLLLLKKVFLLNPLKNEKLKLKLYPVLYYPIRLLHFSESIIPKLTIDLKKKNLLRIYRKHRYNVQQQSVLFKTNHGSSFIIRNVGLIFPTRSIYNYTNFELYRIRKKVYSFLKKNEYKAHIFNFRKKQIL